MVSIILMLNNSKSLVNNLMDRRVTLKCYLRRVCTCRKGANKTYMHKVVNLYSTIMLDLKHPPSSYSTGKDKKTKCRDEYHAALKNPSSGRFKPRCNLDGTYAKVQCSGSDCYCADKDGNEIMGTKTPMVAGKPVCEKPGMCFWPRFFQLYFCHP